ncbi:predicted protein [Streptomyces viridosporus ATCC 14672]|uniref:Predicted protein n=1 Tax=Streptomyces viridosporus (strain ATCC 14672 / DSM 40746 / JCM 4963 / KCTC 9882 / NRRL B-12104 / FH 1290) TaxID=566461 RepID=D5ZQ12_STRV1|nr:predicted protein [Streptomyces viridosporus ATCC 14672]
MAAGGAAASAASPGAARAGRGALIPGPDGGDGACAGAGGGQRLPAGRRTQGPGHLGDARCSLSVRRTSGALGTGCRIRW